MSIPGSASPGTASSTAIRLDSAYSLADVNSLRRYSLGDFITGSLSWTRALHMEGVQIRSDFSMRPDLVTFPLPLISGSAAVPSTVNVLTDGNVAISHSVDAGPFEIPQLPVVSGAGTITMTVTNPLGQQVTLTQPFYASSTLLTPGLQTFAGQVGLVRRNWGSVSNDYGKLAATAVSSFPFISAIPRYCGWLIEPGLQCRKAAWLPCVQPVPWSQSVTMARPTLRTSVRTMRFP